ncbi:heparan-alpha-glucosaminide N-acetyltransferase [Candidatus Aenigmatarchaeota archaeon]
MNKRFWEIDFLRGIAIIMMVIFHFLFDIYYFDGLAFNPHSGFWWVFARITASIFIILVGVSLTLSHSRARHKGIVSGFSKYLKRGLKIFGWGIAITVLTWLFLPSGLIMFGVLHLIGISIILAYPLMRYRYLNFVLGTIFILIGVYLSTMTFDFYWLVWLGFMPHSFYTLDYFPIFSWFGVVLIGIMVGNILYKDYVRRFRLPDISNNRLSRLLCYLGRHSLMIYLIHQPILIVLLYLFGIVDFGMMLH